MKRAHQYNKSLQPTNPSKGRLAGAPSDQTSQPKSVFVRKLAALITESLEDAPLFLGILSSTHSHPLLHVVNSPNWFLCPNLVYCVSLPLSSTLSPLTTPLHVGFNIPK